jgi:hypothetical protein
MNHSAAAAGILLVSFAAKTVDVAHAQSSNDTTLPKIIVDRAQSAGGSDASTNAPKTNVRKRKQAARRRQRLQRKAGLLQQRRCIKRRRIRNTEPTSSTLARSATAHYWIRRFPSR